MNKVKLGEVVDIISGFAFDSKMFNEYKGTPLIRIRDIKRGYTETYTSQEYDKKYIIKKGDILIGMDGEFNIGKWKAKDALLNQRVCKIIPKKIDEDYMFFLLPKKLKEIENKTAFVTVKHLSVKQIENIEINLIEIEQQKEIAKRLRIISRIIEIKQIQKEQLDELIKSQFVEMFENDKKEKLLADVVWFQEGPGVRSSDFTEEGTILLTGSNINDNSINFGLKSDRYISESLSTGKYKHFMCDKNDILVVSSAIDPNKFDKKIVIVEEDKKYCLNTGIIRFKPDLNIFTLGYFREFLKTDYFKSQVINQMRGIAQMHFGPSHLKKMKVIIPDSKEKQIEFEEFVKLIDKQKFEIQKSLDEMQNLYESLMNEYFG